MLNEQLSVNSVYQLTSYVTNFHLILKGKCQDRHEHCESWATHGFCTMNPDPMLKTCPDSCGICNEVCKDNFPDCPGWAKYGFCRRTAKNTEGVIKFMWNNCKKACGVCTTGSYCFSRVLNQISQKTQTCISI